MAAYLRPFPGKGLPSNFHVYAWMWARRAENCEAARFKDLQRIDSSSTGRPQKGELAHCVVELPMAILQCVSDRWCANMRGTPTVTESGFTMSVQRRRYLV